MLACKVVWGKKFTERHIVVSNAITTNKYSTEMWGRWRDGSLCAQWIQVKLEMQQRDAMAVIGMRKGCSGQGPAVSWPSRVSRVVCRSLELVQTQPLNTLPSHKITLALSNDKMSEMKNVVHFLA